MTAEEKATRLVRRVGGVFLRRCKHGELWRLPSGAVVQLPTGSPSDRRTWSNALAAIRRALRGVA